VKRWERRHNLFNGLPEVVATHRFRWAAVWLARHNCATHGCYVVDLRTRAVVYRARVHRGRDTARGIA
jgi:hypothetical protein